ncbi:probable disease resistance protein At5g43730 [Hevea brasiliensis]|uniref:probable disease resistance protein At5g43730 n=1 Tax=Hevea brasiliensis TaxID=3981 RepID=UPI0025E8DA3E|nr:probable disease resistance protein At5g43730 [Hevea brasiliensis]
MQQLYKVTDWLDRVDRLQEDAKEMIKEAEEEIHNKALRCFYPKKCCSSNRVGERISESAKRKPADLVIQMPVPKTFGLDSKLEDIWRWIEDPSVEIIGLYGMGGVGKTTLLRKIYNKICEKSDYVVIFVERSEQDPVKAAKEAICKKIEIPREDWINKGEAINKAIWNTLRKEKFALMLDGVGGQWQHLLLEEIGVHLNGNGNGSKVIFTTRSKEVCDRMKAKTIEVECLPPETALQLFEFCVGEDALNANWEIPMLAKELADVCNGLPLLLTTIGRAMASKTKPGNWKRAIEKLRTQPSTFPDVEASVFSVLKISYDSLNTDSLRNCFCAFRCSQELII